MARVLIGTSGWHYDSWRGPFFPKGLPLKAQLQFYASQFSSAELNGVFYRTPTPEAVESWRLQTGKDFVFAWKASKFITHWKRLSESSANSLELLEDRLALLGNKVGPILFQLPKKAGRPCWCLAKLAVRNRKVMGDLVVRGWLYALGWTSTVAMALCIVGMFVSLLLPKI
jgi:uncharacterized protein YecE (DUF72 family)